MNIQLETLHKYLHNLGKILNEFPDTTYQDDDTQATTEFKHDFRNGLYRLREDFDLYLNDWLKELDDQLGEVEDD